MLNPDQIKHFNTFGFLVLPGVFSTDEIAMMRQAADDVLAEARQGEPFDGKASQTVMPFFERRETMRPFLEDDRIYQIALDLLGPGFLLVLSEAHYSVGDVQWHGDHRTRGVLPNLKMGIYLEPVNGENGCLRVIPGSHRSPFFEALHAECQWGKPGQSNERPFGMDGADLACVDLESEPGDMVLFTEEVFHASFGGRTGRPRLALNFEAKPDNEQRIEIMRKEHGNTRWMYRPARSMMESDSPRLRGLVAPLHEQLGFEIFEA